MKTDQEWKPQELQHRHELEGLLNCPLCFKQTTEALKWRTLAEMRLMEVEEESFNHAGEGLDPNFSVPVELMETASSYAWCRTRW